MARPPSTYDGRTSTGYPIALRHRHRLVHARGGAIRRLRDARAARAIASKRRRSSAMSIASGDVPRMRTPAASSGRVSLSGV